VFNANGAVAYVIAVTMPSFRFQEQTHERTAAMVLATARGLSMRLGFRQEIAPAS
jgi:DNA-binding IclR family transcriptional regulator